MPKTEVVFFQEVNGEAPVLTWLEQLLKRDRKAWANCRARIELLSQYGHELKRPAADYLRDGIYELRVKRGHVQYRMLYFFHGRQVAILAHALTKEDKVPVIEIERSLRRKKLFEADPKRHTYERKD